MSKKQITLFDSWSKNSLSQNASTSVNVLDSEQIVSRTFHKLPMHDAAASSVFQVNFSEYLNLLTYIF